MMSMDQGFEKSSCLATQKLTNFNQQYCAILIVSHSTQIVSTTTFFRICQERVQRLADDLLQSLRAMFGPVAHSQAVELRTMAS